VRADTSWPKPPNHSDRRARLLLDDGVPSGPEHLSHSAKLGNRHSPEAIWLRKTSASERKKSTGAGVEFRNLERQYGNNEHRSITVTDASPIFPPICHFSSAEAAV